ncbi:MAG TPA: alpha/beta hydrolase [Gammaproteobacteria bacterium]|nr:alpha/beta hydrolase [Gammaproteobacteria bacterium]
MKNAILLQGIGETTKSFWLPYAKEELEKKSYKVWLPQLPDNNDPDLKKSLPFVLKNGIFTKETVIIGRSAGCPLTLSILENLKVQIKQAILVAGFATPLPVKGAATKILQKKYNWKKIGQHIKDIIFINSDNDPWGCDDKQGRYMLDRLGGKLIILCGEGHMGSDMFKQPYKKFPFLIKLID